MCTSMRANNRTFVPIFFTRRWSFMFRYADFDMKMLKQIGGKSEADCFSFQSQKAPIHSLGILWWDASFEMCFHHRINIVYSRLFHCLSDKESIRAFNGCEFKYMCCIHYISFILINGFPHQTLVTHSTLLHNISILSNEQNGYEIRSDIDLNVELLDGIKMKRR